MFTVEDSYLEDEIKDGFYIPSISKRAFASELALLNELDRICKKYGLKYFADWGSMLGAIRHRGFIPWDDDLDVCMHRNDLEKLLEVADRELSDGFEIHSFENNDYSWKFIYNLVNTDRMCFEPEYLKTHYNFPYIATIDIFVLDNVSDDEEYEEKRKSDIKYILNIADLTEEENLKKQEYINDLKKACGICGISIDYNTPVIEIKRILYRAVQNILKEKNNIETEYVVQMIPWGVYHDIKIHRSYYEEAVSVPFENTTISVPKNYYSLFRKHKYGNFWEIVFGVGGHGYPYYESQRESLGVDVDYVPHYKFSEEQLVKDDSRKANSLKAIAGEYSEYLKIAYNDILAKIGDIANSLSNNAENNIGSFESGANDLMGILTQCQENAIQFGTLVEKVKGENTNTVAHLEKYCEYLFEISQLLNELPRSADKLPVILEEKFKTCTDSIISEIDLEITSRRTVVFLPFKGKYFKTLRPFYEDEKNRENTDVYVVPLPYFYKEYNGTIKGEAQYDLNAYPEGIELTDYTEFDLELAFPDVIYIQNPYDEFNMATSIPRDFYASVVKDLTDNLIYVPWFETSDFDKENYPQNYNMKFYCTVPGVVLSDTVYVSSEKIRIRYIEKLEEFSGKKYKSLWEEKIKVSPYTDSKGKKRGRNQKKQLCFYTSPSSLLENKDTYISKIKNCISIFDESKENINIIWRIEPYELDMIKSYDEDIYNELDTLMNDIKKTDNIKLDFETDEAEITDTCDAYYGDGSYLSKDFVIAGKPVMIMDINV